MNAPGTSEISQLCHHWSQHFLIILHQHITEPVYVCKVWQVENAKSVGVAYLEPVPCHKQTYIHE